MQLPGAVVQITDGGDQLVYLAHQLRIVHVDVQIQPHAVDGGRVHLEVRHVGGDDRVDPLTGQDGVGQLLVAAHIGNGSAAADNVPAALGVQRERGLQGVVVIEAAAAALVFRDGEPDLQRAALSRHVLRGVFFSVQIVADGDIPRQRGVFHCSLIVDLIGGGEKGDLIPILGDRVVGVQGLDGGVIAVVQDIAAGENIDRLDIRYLAGGVCYGVDDLLLGRGRGLGKGRYNCGIQQQHSQRRRGEFLHMFH